MKHKKRFQLISVTTLGLVILLYWIIWFIYGYTWIKGFDYVSNILRIFTFIGLLITVLSIILVAMKIKSDFKSDKSLSISRKIGTLIIFVVFIAIHSIMYNSFSDGGDSIGGLMSIADKQVDDGKYYFYVTHNNHLVKIRCTNDVYENLIVDKDVGYTFTYRWLSYINDKGVLDGEINTTDIIDNRHPKTN